MTKPGWRLVVLGLVAVIGIVGTWPVQADEANVFFDDSFVHEVYITFADADWYNTLYLSHANDPDDPYFPAAVECDGVAVDEAGVRFKGNSSFGIPGVKKSFKIDFNEYNDDTNYVGLKKLNLNNGFKDPTMMRAKLFVDFAGAFVPAIRAVHTRVYVNGTYWGLYTAVEQVDKTFAQSRFGDDEDGNLFKGEASDDASGPNSNFGSDLTWLGSDPEPYHDSYQLKTNETEDDYSQLIEFIDILNNQSPVNFPTLLEPVFDVQNALAALALNNLFVNLDSYNGSAHNYYVYDRDDSGKITHIHWDTNEAFGRFLMFVANGDDPLEMDPFWLPESTGPPSGGGQERPLMENLWANSDYSNDYLCYLQQMLDQGFGTATIEPRIDELADLIRADVYADSNKMYSNAEFEQNLYSDITDGRNTIYGLLNFVQQRAAYLDGELDNFVLDCAVAPSDLVGTLFINEFMAENDTTIQDPDGTGFPDWIEIFNAGSSTIDIGGLYVTDDLSDPTKWQFPLGVSIEAYGYLLIWADNDEPQGDTHTNFKLGASGEEIGLYDSDGVSEIDSIIFGAQYADVSYGRYPDGADSWDHMATPTPGSANGSHSAPPVITDTAHSPAWPTGGDAVWVTTTVTDDGSVGGVTLTYDAGGGAVELSMLDDGAHRDGNAGDGVYGEQLPAQVTGTIVTYFLTAADNLGSASTDPTGAPSVTYSYLVGYTPPALFINELMADNDTTIEDPDEAEAYDDWVEIYNAGDTTVDLGGMYLTDDAEDPTQWQIPSGVTIGPGAHLLFWADDDEDQGDTHTNFKLSADGEYIGLYDTDDDRNMAIDSLAFGAQTTDIPLGRCPDGGENWMLLTVPTPGDENWCGSNSLTFIPAAGFASGAGGSSWVTDVDLNNAGSDTMTYSFWWLPRGEDNSQPTMSTPVTLGPGMSVRYANLLNEVFGLDSADSPFGAIAISASGPDVLSIARIFNQAEAEQGGAFGQALPGVGAGDLIMEGETRRLIFMSEDDDSRANLGCQNGTDGDISINYEKFDDAGTSLEVGTMDLAAYSNDQINRIFRDNSPVNGYVDVSSDTAGAAFYCYGSVVDNVTGDPTTILPQFPMTNDLYFISAAGFASGAEDSFWVTDVDLNNAGPGMMTYEFWWLPRGEDNSQPMVSDSFNLDVGMSVRYANILGEVFGLDSADAPFGAIAISASGSDALSIARIFNQAETEHGGTFGQALPGVGAGNLIMEGETRRLIFMSEDDDFRANLGCQNGTDGDISINYEKFDAAGTSLEVGTMDLAAYSNDQINRIFLDNSPVNGYVDVWSDTVGVAFYCYGSVIDNVTGDPTTILPQ